MCQRLRLNLFFKLSSVVNMTFKLYNLLFLSATYNVI